jgi:hypothetical protein
MPDEPFDLVVRSCGECAFRWEEEQ